MMNKQPETSGRSGRKFLAGTALITSLVALFAAFLESWQLTAMVVAVAALGAAVFSFRKGKPGGAARSLSGSAMAVSVIALVLSAFFLSQRVEAEAPPAVPPELHDSAVTPTDASTLERLRMSMDSTQAE